MHAILIRTIKDVGFHGLKNIPNNMRNVKCSPVSDCNPMEINAKYTREIYRERKFRAAVLHTFIQRIINK